MADLVLELSFFKAAAVQEEKGMITIPYFEGSLPKEGGYWELVKAIVRPRKEEDSYFEMLLGAKSEADFEKALKGTVFSLETEAGKELREFSLEGALSILLAYHCFLGNLGIDSSPRVL